MISVSIWQRHNEEALTRSNIDDVNGLHVANGLRAFF